MSKFIQIAAIALIVGFAAEASAQGFNRPVPGRPGTQPGNRGNNNNNNNRQDDKPEVKLPEDPKLLELHKSFVLGAEKLALEYEQKNQIDKARSCYEEIIRLVPTYTPASEKLATIKQKEATADRRTFDV